MRSGEGVWGHGGSAGGRQEGPRGAAGAESSQHLGGLRGQAPGRRDSGPHEGFGFESRVKSSGEGSEQKSRMFCLPFYQNRSDGRVENKKN